MAGNTVVLKASEIAPRCSWAIGSVFRDAGLPPGVLNVFCHASKDAAVVTQALISHPSVKKINFTGSTAVGRIIAREAGQHLKPVLLELGGKASAIVMGDANLPEAAKNCIMGALLHVGIPNSCPSPFPNNPLFRVARSACQRKGSSCINLS
jgi:acyl-CoA reductase-like NAD-dependent aldehyde dehydrogenase